MQCSSVEDCVWEFEILAAETMGTSKEQLMGYLLVGFQKDIGGQFRVHDPKDLIRAVKVNHDVEGPVFTRDKAKS